MTEIKALVFDVDGTLADTERDGHRVAFNRAFDDAGLDWHWDEALYGELLSVTGGKERIKHYLAHYNTAFAKPDGFDDFVAGLHKAKTAHYMALMAEGRIPLRPGVVRLFDEARSAGIPLAIATTTTMENVTSLIASTLPEGAMGWFDVVGAGDIVPNKKPAPDIYDWVLAELGLQGGDVVAFEDSGHGVTSAAEAGIDRIVVTRNGYTVTQDFTRASMVLDDLGEPGRPANVICGDCAGLVDLDCLRSL